MSTKKYDFVVEGGRIAGSLVSKLFAEEGYSIAVCDPTFRKKPGKPLRLEDVDEKPCGGIVDSEVRERFEIPETAEYKGEEYPVIDTEVERYGFVSPDKKTLLEYLPTKRDFVVRRRNLDFWNFVPLLYMKNVDFYPSPIKHVKETKDGFVNILGNGQKIIGDGEIGAGGVSSRVRKDIFWKVSDDRFCRVMINFLYFSKEKVRTEFKNTAYFWFHPDLGYGYSFAIPGSNYVRVGVGEKIRKSQTAEVLPKCYNEFVNHRIFRRKLSNPRKIVELSHACPFGKSINFYDNHPASGLSRIKKLAGRKVLLGEAAFHTNYLTFEGIRFAMLDAQLAWNCWARDNSFENFDSEWRRQHGKEIVKPQYQIEDFYDKEKLTELFKLAKEIDRAETLVLAFKGKIHVSEPGIVRRVIEPSNMEQNI